jgi:hypothetical protein
VTGPSEGFKEFKGFKEFELLRNREEQILQPSGLSSGPLEAGLVSTGWKR